MIFINTWLQPGVWHSRGDQPF